MQLDKARRWWRMRAPHVSTFVFPLAVFPLLVILILLVSAEETPAEQRASLAPEAALALGPKTNLPLPRYESLRSSEINVRRGPGLDYRKDWVFKRAGLPVRVVDEYGDWLRIEDSDNAGGWVYHALLTRRRTVLIIDRDVPFRQRPEVEAQVLARAEQGVVARLLECSGSWCQVEAERITGWVRKAEIWGVDAAEDFTR